MSDTPTPTPVADAIREMEDRLADERYWCKHAYHRGEAMCLTSVRAKVSGWHDFSSDLLDLMIEVGLTFKPWEGQRFSLILFNDHPSITHADIMLYLATCLDVAEAEGI